MPGYASTGWDLAPITRRRARRGTPLRELQDKYIDRMVVLNTNGCLTLYDYSRLRRSYQRMSSLRMRDGEVLEVYKVDFQGVYTRHRGLESTEQYIPYGYFKLPEEFRDEPGRA